MGWDLVTLLGFVGAMLLFAAIWFFVVVPSERRDHERRLEILRKRIAEREALKAQQQEEGAGSD